MTSAELDRPTTERRIVVGVDGSEGGAKALDWAVSEAQRSGLVLDIVTAWMFPMALGYAFTSTVDTVRKSAERLVQASITYVTEIAPEVTVRGEAFEKQPAQALLDASHGADLLVVGSRGMGGFAGLVLGSVSQYCTRHAPCPVVVAR